MFQRSTFIEHFFSYKCYTIFKCNICKIWTARKSLITTNFNTCRKCYTCKASLSECTCANSFKSAWEIDAHKFSATHKCTVTNFT